MDNPHATSALALVLGKPVTTEWHVLLAEVKRLKARVDRADAASREWASNNRAKVKASNKEAQRRRRAKAKGGA